jgi:F-box/leucine-rich repeat protein 2/20
LEELDISFLPLFSDSLEVIGQCCPLLKSLKHSTMATYDFICDDDAFAIAKTMPGLRHLQLYGNALTNDGLLAILDGCPLLESLVLSRCYSIHVSESLEKRCREKIKYLQLP